MHERREYFEIHEANALIPQLEYYFGELARIQREVNRLAKEADKYGIKLTLDDLQESGGNVANDILRRKCSVLTKEYSDLIDEIHSLGVVVEDTDLGLVNFYSLSEGDEVILSWQYGEPQVSHWYRSNEDFMARRPLNPDSNSQEAQAPLH
jgi:hypothetical protein